MGLGDALRMAGLACVHSRIRASTGGSVSVLSISRAHRLSALHLGDCVGPCSHLLDERRPARLAMGRVEGLVSLLSACATRSVWHGSIAKERWKLTLALAPTMCRLQVPLQFGANWECQEFCVRA